MSLLSRTTRILFSLMVMIGVLESTSDEPDDVATEEGEPYPVLLLDTIFFFRFSKCFGWSEVVVNFGCGLICESKKYDTSS